jgi:D-galactonate transporter
MSVLSGSPEISARAEIDLENATFSKIAWRLMPLIFVGYLLAFLDRINVGYAQLQMKSALGFSDAVYGLGAGLFFASYLLLEVPSNLLFERIGARLTITRIMVLWGAASAATMFVSTPREFYTLRFLLGACEAGMFPGILFYLTFWFPSARRAKATGLFLFSLPIAGVLGGPISGWILGHMDGINGWQGWQWLFLLEGLPSIVVGVIWYIFTSNDPASAKWLSREEKSIVAAALRRDGNLAGQHKNTLDAFRDPRVYVLGFIFFTNFCGVYTFSFWLPTMIKAMGVTDVGMIGMISLIPYACGALGMLSIGFSSDHFRERRWHIVLPTVVSAVALSASTLITASLPLSIALLSVAAFGIMGSSIAFWAVPPTYLNGRARASGIALVSSIGASGGFISPNIVGQVKMLTGSIDAGLYVMTGILCLGALVVLWALPGNVMRIAGRESKA